MSSLLRRVLKRTNARGKRLQSKPRSRRIRARPPRRSTNDEKIRRFEKWCRETGINLHPQVGGAHFISVTLCTRYVLVHTQLYIGRTGSCADVGVVAREAIPQGSLLAVIPRHTLLNASNSRVGPVLLSDQPIRRQLKTMNSWVPLLLALLAEYGQKVACSSCL